MASFASTESEIQQAPPPPPPPLETIVTVENQNPAAPTSSKLTEEDENSGHTKDFGLIPIPKRLQHNPDKPFRFGLLLNISFAFASTFIIANLYYCQPLLIEFSKTFNVTYEEVSGIPTLIQIGYLVGLLLISPLGDRVRRRQAVLLLVASSTALTIGLAITKNLLVFEALSFLTGVATVTPQILIPLSTEVAPPGRKASAFSVVFTGLMLGILLARVLAGIIANFTTWRAVYYMSVGVQSLVLVGAYLILPDYPAKNRDSDLTYFRILMTMARACFTGFWITLTFLLAGPPYYYSTLVIGLFGLTGILGVLCVPFTGRILDKLTPWYAILVATSGLMVFQAVQTAAGGINVVAVVIACFGLDMARQSQQLSISTHIMSISETARSRLNAIYNIQLFVGQVIGTSVGTQVFMRYGWRACSAMMLALFGFQMAVLLVRGPYCPRERWFGYQGGLKKRVEVEVEAKPQPQPQPQPQPPPRKEVVFVLDSDLDSDSEMETAVETEVETETETEIGIGCHRYGDRQWEVRDDDWERQERAGHIGGVNAEDLNRALEELCGKCWNGLCPRDVID